MSSSVLRIRFLAPRKWCYTCDQDAAVSLKVEHVKITIELDVSNRTRKGSVTSSSMVISKKMKMNGTPGPGFDAR